MPSLVAEGYGQSRHVRAISDSGNRGNLPQSDCDRHHGNAKIADAAATKQWPGMSETLVSQKTAPAWVRYRPPLLMKLKFLMYGSFLTGSKVRMSSPISRALGFKRSQREVRRAGDRARDAKRWSEAATHYAAYLKYNPKDVPIRVQLGNCLKEAGQLTKALDAYKTAIELDGEHADGHLQIGHLFKILGRNMEAAQAYRKSFELTPHDNPAFAELLSIGTVPQVRGSDHVDSQETAIIYMDVTDLIDYLQVNVTLSGIQRVVSNLIANIPKLSGTTGYLVRPVLPDYSGSQVFIVNVSLLEGLISLVTSGRSDRELIDRALDSLRASQSLVMPKAGDTLLIPGAFWIYQRYDLLNILRQSGVRVAVFIHDLIQVTNPEFVEPAATTVFRRSLVDVLCVSSYVLTNSTFVANNVRRYLETRMNFELPVTPVTLATELNQREMDNTDTFHEYKELAKEGYVLCVGTIEIRKNHTYLIEIWERLIRESHGSVPNLVFVGKWGWEIAALRKYLEGSDYLGGRLYIYDAIPDGELAFLYKNCLFTIFPSFAEGWGLPVGEKSPATVNLVLVPKSPRSQKLAAHCASISTHSTLKMAIESYLRC